jgi:hypothetical protein
MPNGAALSARGAVVGAATASTFLSVAALLPVAG